MRRFLPRPLYVLIFLGLAFWYADALFLALGVLVAGLWMFGPAILVAQVARNLRVLAQAAGRRR